MRKQIVITGATGLIGSYLTKQLKDKYDLILLTRNPNKYTNSDSIKYVRWDGKTVIPQVLEGCYAVVNLIGENIGGKSWTPQQKKLILDSRKDAATALLESFRKCKNKPNVWIQASATGFYGQQSGILFDESAPKAKDSFLADVCEEWERPIKELNEASVRKVIVRTGVVLAKNSDLWKQLNMSFAFGVASVVGNGKQYLPWIHIDDEVNVILSALEHDNWSGIFNLSAPESSTMEEVIRAIKSERKSFITLHIPRWFLRILFGKEKTDELVLTNQHVSPKHLLANGFVFTYPSIKTAVKKLLE